MDRNAYIGSSDARDILYGSWRDLWMIKTGRAQRPNLDDEFRVALGRVTEPFHLDWTIARLRERDGLRWMRKLATNGGQHFVVHPEHRFIAAHPDEILVSEIDGAEAPVEAKFGNRGYMNKEQLAEHYMPQMQHHLLCMGAPAGMFSFSLDRDEPVRMWIGASALWHDVMVGNYIQFWAYVEADTPPPTAGFASRAVIEAPPIDDVPIDGMVARDASKDNEFVSLAHEFIETQAAAQRHEKAKDSLKKLVKKTEREVYVPGLLRLKRTASGSLRFTVEKPAAAEG